MSQYCHVWHNEWLETQGFIYNDDDLIHVNEGHIVDVCSECGGTGESVTRDWDDHRKQRVRKCKACVGVGFVELRA